MSTPLNIKEYCFPFPYQAKQRQFNASGPQAIRDQAVEQARLTALFPYPPKNCAEAQSYINLIEDKIKSYQEKQASGDKKADKYVTSLLNIKSQFEGYLTRAKCIEKVTSAEDAAFEEKLKQTLDDEAARQQSSGNTKTIVIFAIIGFVVIGGLLILLRKKT